MTQHLKRKHRVNKRKRKRLAAAAKKAAPKPTVQTEATVKVYPPFTVLLLNNGTSNEVQSSGNSPWIVTTEKI